MTLVGLISPLDIQPQLERTSYGEMTQKLRRFKTDTQFVLAATIGPCVLSLFLETSSLFSRITGGRGDVGGGGGWLEGGGPKKLQL